MSPSPAEFVKSLSRLDRQAVFASLVEDIYDEQGRTTTLPLTNPAGESIGYLVPPSDEVWNALASKTLDLDACLTDEELEQLTRKAMGESPQ